MLEERRSCPSQALEDPCQKFPQPTPPRLPQFLCRWPQSLDPLGSVPYDPCNYYGKCGAFGKCQLQNNKFECTCLPGFRPKSPSEWSLRNTSGGCVRKRGQESICKSGDRFVKVENVMLPDSSFAQLDKELSLKECKQQCLQNCNCTAYGGMDTQEQVGCLRWHGDLIDTSVLIGGQNLYVRVDALELGTQQFTMA
nr:g-type lectin s-receptor-like serine/threonine-protein kinase rks1 [Quercus suber]